MARLLVAFMLGVGVLASSDSPSGIFLTDADLFRESGVYLANLCDSHGRDSRVCKFARDYLNAMTDEKLRIGMTGASGVGKSTLTNTLIGMKSSAPGAAKACPDGECTGVKVAYNRDGFESSVSKMLRFIDTPGCGTVNFPEKTYVEDVGLNEMDGIVLVANNRFSSCDANIYRALIEDGRRPALLVLNSKDRIDEDPDEEEDDDSAAEKKKKLKERIAQIKRASIDAMASSVCKSKFEKATGFASDDKRQSDLKSNRLKCVENQLEFLAAPGNEPFLVDARFKKRNDFEMPELRRSMVASLAKVQQRKLQRLLEDKFADNRVQATSMIHVATGTSGAVSAAMAQFLGVGEIATVTITSVLVSRIAKLYAVTPTWPQIIAFTTMTGLGSKGASVGLFYGVKAVMGVVPIWGNALQGGSAMAVTYSAGTAALENLSVDKDMFSNFELTDDYWKGKLASVAKAAECVDLHLERNDAKKGTWDTSKAILGCFDVQRSEL